MNLAGFGCFKVQDRPERNPATGEAMTFAAGRKLTFTPAKAALNRWRAGRRGSLRRALDGRR